MRSWTDRLEALLKRRPRVLLGITGPPGAGKSTLTESVAVGINGAVYVPMDGFHLSDVELTRLGRQNRKGAIDISARTGISLCCNAFEASVTRPSTRRRSPATSNSPARVAWPAAVVSRGRHHLLASLLKRP